MAHELPNVEDLKGPGLLFRFVGKYHGLEMLPREILGPYASDKSGFWTSFLRVGELFVWNGNWYQVVVNKLEPLSGDVHRYIFYAVPEEYSIREE